MKIDSSDHSNSSQRPKLTINYTTGGTPSNPLPSITTDYQVNNTWYLNGSFKTNVTKGVQYYNAANLSHDTSYTISTHTVDTSGNINHTWVNHTARTAPGSKPSVTNPSASPSMIPDDTDNVPRWGELSQLNVTVTGSIASVAVDLSQIGGQPAQPMNNTGGNIWSVAANASNGTPPQTYYLNVSAADIYGNSNTSVSIPLVVMRNGDVNGDNIVNMADAMLLANYASYPGKYTISSESVAEVSGNGIVNIGDAIFLATYVSDPGNYTLR